MSYQRNYAIRRAESLQRKSECQKQETAQECCKQHEPCSCNKCHRSHCKCQPCHQEDKQCHWNALDPTMNHPMFNNDNTVNQGQNSQVKNVQQSSECIVIKDSCDVDVRTTETQASVNIQVALQAAIALVVSISIADSNVEDEITQDLFAKIKSSQVNNQQLYIENSRGVNVTTTDTDIAVNAQILLQVLIAIVARLDIL